MTERKRDDAYLDAAFAISAILMKHIDLFSDTAIEGLRAAINELDHADKTINPEEQS